MGVRLTKAPVPAIDRPADAASIPNTALSTYGISGSVRQPHEHPVGHLQANAMDPSNTLKTAIRSGRVTGVHTAAWNLALVACHGARHRCSCRGRLQHHPKREASEHNAQLASSGCWSAPAIAFSTKGGRTKADSCISGL